MDLHQLLKQTGITPRTLKEYRRLGLVPAPARQAVGGRGFTAEYPQWTARRIAQIRQLQAGGLPLLAIRDRLVARASDAEEREALQREVAKQLATRRGRQLTGRERVRLAESLRSLLRFLPADEIWRRLQEQPDLLDRLLEPAVGERIPATEEQQRTTRRPVRQSTDRRSRPRARAPQHKRAHAKRQRSGSREERGGPGRDGDAHRHPSASLPQTSVVFPDRGLRRSHQVGAVGDMHHHEPQRRAAGAARADLAGGRDAAD